MQKYQSNAFTMKKIHHFHSIFLFFSFFKNRFDIFIFLGSNMEGGTKMKKDLILIVLISGIFLTSCDNIVCPQIAQQKNNLDIVQNDLFYNLLSLMVSLSQIPFDYYSYKIQSSLPLFSLVF